MQIGCVQLLDFRNYRTLSYRPSGRLNLLTGRNAQGKTNALEAVGVLGGVPRMVQVIGQVETGPMKPEQARDYELLEARVRDRIEHRDQDAVRRGGGN